MIQDNKQLWGRLQELLHGQPDAIRFFYAWFDYCHYIDDLVDGDIDKTPENVLRLCVKAAALYSSNFYQRYATSLYPVVLTITNTYADTVKWEDSQTAWKQQHADVMRHCGNDMIIMVVGLVAGWDAVREISEMLHEQSYLDHHTTEGIPV